MMELRGTDIGALCAKRRWKRVRLILELRRAAAAREIVLPDDDSLKRMIRGWNGGSRGLSEHYADLLSDVFGVPFAAGRPRSAAARSAAGTGEDADAEAPTDLPAGRNLVPGDEPLRAAAGEVLTVEIDRRLLMAGGGAAAVEFARHDLLGSLAADRAAADVGEWQEIGWEYSLAYTSAPPAALLASLQVDLAALGGALRRHPFGSPRRELQRTAAHLAVFAACTVANLGDLRSARRWWRTAKQAADACGDLETRLWVRGREIVRALAEQRPTPAILGLVADAEAIGATAPPAALPELLSGKARAFAVAGQPALATAALDEVRDNFARLPAHVTRDTGSIFDYPEYDVYFTESYVSSCLGDAVGAGGAQAAARALRPAARLRGPAQLDLHHALCQVRVGDVAPGVEHAHAAMTGLPREHHVRPVVDLGRKVLDAVPVAERGRDGVRAFRAYLGGHEATSGRSPTPDRLAQR